MEETIAIHGMVEAYLQSSDFLPLNVLLNFYQEVIKEYNKIMNVDINYEVNDENVGKIVKTLFAYFDFLQNKSETLIVIRNVDKFKLNDKLKKAYYTDNNMLLYCINMNKWIIYNYFVSLENAIAESELILNNDINKKYLN